MSGRCGRGIEPDAVVADARAHGPVDFLDADLDRGGAGVVAHVGERLGDHAVDHTAQLERWLCVQIDLQARAQAVPLGVGEQFGDRLRQACGLEAGRPQLEEQRAQALGRQLEGLLDFGQRRLLLGLGEPYGQRVELQTERAEDLEGVAVDVCGDAPALAFARLDQLGEQLLALLGELRGGVLGALAIGDVDVDDPDVDQRAPDPAG